MADRTKALRETANTMLKLASELNKFADEIDDMELQIEYLSDEVEKNKRLKYQIAQLLQDDIN